LRGIDKKIAALKTELNYSTSGDRDQFLAGLLNLETEKTRLAQGAMGAHLDSESEQSGGSPSNKDEDEQVCIADVDSDSDDASACDADEAHVPMRDSGETIGAGITVTQKELRVQFHLPLHTVAKKFGMCTTAFKKLCRRFGISKWPHRQLRGIDKKIAALRAELSYSTVDKESARHSLLKLEEDKARLSNGAEWTGLGLDLEDEARCDSLHVSSSGEQESSSQRVGIHNLLCDVSEERGGSDHRAPNVDLHVILADQSIALGGVAITEDILREHFHLPLQVVAKKFGMCTTALKKLCRRFGISRWPHRQLRGIDKKIAALRAELNYSTVDKASARRNLVALEQEKMRLSRVALGHASAPSSSSSAPVWLSKGLLSHEAPSSSRTSSAETAAQALPYKRRAEGGEQPDANKSAKRERSFSADASALDLLAAVAGLGAQVAGTSASCGPCVHTHATHSHQASDIALAMGASSQQRLFSDTNTHTHHHLAPLQQPSSVPRLSLLSHAHAREAHTHSNAGMAVHGLRHIHITNSSSCASAMSTPRLEPLSPSVTGHPTLDADIHHREPLTISPMVRSGVFGGEGERGGGAWMQEGNYKSLLILDQLVSLVGAKPHAQQHTQQHPQQHTRLLLAPPWRGGGW